MSTASHCAVSHIEGLRSGGERTLHAVRNSRIVVCRPLLGPYCAKEPLGRRICPLGKRQAGLRPAGSQRPLGPQGHSYRGHKGHPVTHPFQVHVNTAAVYLLAKKSLSRGRRKSLRFQNKLWLPRSHITHHPADSTAIYAHPMQHTMRCDGLNSAMALSIHTRHAHL